MSKKNIKKTKIKKAVKSLKGKPTSKKVKLGKVVKPKLVKKTPVKSKAKEKLKSKLKKDIKPIKKTITKKPIIKAKVQVNSKKGLAVKSSKKETKIKIESKKLGLSDKKDNKKATIAKHKKEEKIVKTIATLKKDPKDKNILGSKLKPSRSRRGRKKKNKGDDDEPEILHDELVEQLIRSTKKLRSQPKVPKMLKTFVNPMASLTVAVQPNGNKKSAASAKKEPKGKFSVEYVIRTSAGILYEFLTTPSGLSEWFADDVNIHDGIFTFFWDGSAQKARLLGFKEEEYVRMQWLDKPEGSYFEFRIQKDDITGDVSLIVTDFADEASDLETSKRLWDSQVDKLLHIIGSY